MLAPENEDDLGMQIGWNQLFQQFVSDLFVDTEERDAPVVTIDNLDANGRTISSVLPSLRQAVDFVRTKYARRFSPAQLPETSHLSVLAEGLSLYLKSALSTPQYEALSAQLSAAAVHWLKLFMKLEDTTRGLFHRNEETARQYVCRVALSSKYPCFEELGYQALIESQPVFYYTDSAMRDSFQVLGLPITSFRLVTDADELDSMIAEDQQKNHMPVMVLTSVGAASADTLATMRAVSKKHSLFLHVEGDDLALLLTSQPPQFLQQVLTCESFTISPGQWYGLASPSTCTFLCSGLSTRTPVENEDMLALPLWLTMQYVGQERFISIISRARQMSGELYTQLKKNPSIKLHSSEHSLSVLFRYEPVTKPERLFHRDFLNSLNSQVLIDLSETALTLNLDVTYLDKRNCMRFQPLFASDLSSIESSDVMSFVSQLERAIECINATLSCAPDFEEEIQKNQGLQCVHVRNFVGLGAVRYLPTFLRGVNLSPAVSNEVDLVNAQLAQELSRIDGLFSEGTTTEGKVCVCLGVETKPIHAGSPADYAKLITDKIVELQLRARIEEKFGEIISHGIRAAEEYMRAETEQSEGDRGLMRSIPVFGSVMNWWSPVEKNVAGKTFDIGSTALRSVMLSPSSSKNNTPSQPEATSHVEAAPIPLSEDPRESAELSTPPRESSEISTPPRSLSGSPSPRDSEEIPRPLLEREEDLDDLPRPEPLPLPDDE